MEEFLNIDLVDNNVPERRGHPVDQSAHDEVTQVALEVVSTIHAKRIHRPWLDSLNTQHAHELVVDHSVEGTVRIFRAEVPPTLLSTQSAHGHGCCEHQQYSDRKNIARITRETREKFEKKIIVMSVHKISTSTKKRYQQLTYIPTSSPKKVPKKSDECGEREDN